MDDFHSSFFISNFAGIFCFYGPRFRIMLENSLILDCFPDNIPLVAQRCMVSRFCYHWPTSDFWLYNQHFTTIGPKVAFQPIFMSVEFASVCQCWATGGFCSRWWLAIIRDFGKFSKNLLVSVCLIMKFQ